MTEKELWVKRHKLMETIKQDAGSSLMDLINELLEVERELVRLE